MESFTLHNGVSIPKIGFGTYKSTLRPELPVLENALKEGYRHFDTAAFYQNETQIREAVRSSGIDRSELFLTSKVWKEDLGYQSTLKAFEASCQSLGTEYLDLYLIHWPKQVPNDEDWFQKVSKTWKAMEDLYLSGRINAIGVSNFLPHHLIPLMGTARIAPMVNQIEFHPGYPQLATVDFCQKHNILVEAWSPLGRMRVMEEPLLLELSQTYGKSVAQICLRFALQCNVLPLPKASSPERMRENKDIFDFVLSEKDMYRILSLPQIGWSGEHPDRERVYF